jgi:hypothetical protein
MGSRHACATPPSNAADGMRAQSRRGVNSAAVVRRSPCRWIGWLRDRFGQTGRQSDCSWRVPRRWSEAISSFSKSQRRRLFRFEQPVAGFLVKIDLKCGDPSGRRKPRRFCRGFLAQDPPIVIRSCLTSSSSGSPRASAVPRGWAPIAGHSSRHSRGRRHRSVRRRAIPSRHANLHGHHRASPRARRVQRPMPKSVPTRPRPAKPQQMQRARVCATWSSP